MSSSGGDEFVDDHGDGLEIKPPQPKSSRDRERESSSSRHRHHHRSSSGSQRHQSNSRSQQQQQHRGDHNRRYRDDEGGRRSGGVELVEHRSRRRDIQREEEKMLREIQAKREREIRFNLSATTSSSSQQQQHRQSSSSSTTITISTSTQGGRGREVVHHHHRRTQRSSPTPPTPPLPQQQKVASSSPHVVDRRLPEVQEIQISSESSSSSSDGEIHQEEDDDVEEKEKEKKELKKKKRGPTSSSSSNGSLSSEEEGGHHHQQQQQKKTIKKTSKSASSVSSLSSRSSEEEEEGGRRGSTHSNNDNNDGGGGDKKRKRRRNSDSNSSISQDELTPPSPKKKMEKHYESKNVEVLQSTTIKIIKSSPATGEDEDDDEEVKEIKVEKMVKKKDKIDEDQQNQKEEDEFSGLPPYLPALQGCRSVEEFQMLNRIEEGTYGIVFRARDKRTSEIVALKRLKMEKEKEGFPITSLREINTLLKAQHENIVTVREIVVGSNIDKIFLVMDYVEHDLKELMETLKRQKSTFIIGEVKCLLLQLLKAVAHMHDNWILHRDLKTSNLLLSHKGILKVGDFGLAREYGSPLKSYTPIVVTLWYRAPELLLGTKQYSTPIDVWSVGCIFGELLKMEPMFPGKSEANELNLIFQTLGTPNDRIWPGYSQLPLLQKMTFTEYPINKLKSRFPMLTEAGIDLMNKFLTYNPAKRVGAEEALKHRYFTESPLPIDPSVFPTWPAKSELGARPKGYSSPKPPSGGGQFKELQDDPVALYLSGQSVDKFGGGFSLKF